MSGGGGGDMMMVVSNSVNSLLDLSNEQEQVQTVPKS